MKKYQVCIAVCTLLIFVCSGIYGATKHPVALAGTILTALCDVAAFARMKHRKGEN